MYDGSEGEINGAVFGNSGNDILIGWRKDDFLVGGGDNDILLGQRGDDTIEGGLGSDLLIGGRGEDAFVFGADIFQDGQLDVDVILGFDSGDSFSFADEFLSSGQITANRVGGSLKVILGGEDTLVVFGDVEAAEQQLTYFTSGLV